MDDTKGWTRLGSERRFENAFFALDEDRVVDPGGRETSYAVMRWKTRGLRILPVDDEGCTFLVGQHRYGAGYWSWELPAGNREPGERDRAGAERELGEEIGQEAASWLRLGEFVPSGSITDQRDELFLAWDLSARPPRPDPGEALAVWRLPIGEAVEMAASGAIGDTGTVAGLLLAERKALRGDLPEPVLGRVRAGLAGAAGSDARGGER